MFEDFTSCAVCQHNNGEKCELFGRVIGMHGCSNGEPRKPKTNGDKIRAMTDEELGLFLLQLKVYEACPELGFHNCQESCRKCWLEWLQQEAST